MRPPTPTERALFKYGRHEMTCAQMQPEGTSRGDGQCSCGFKLAKEAAFTGAVQQPAEPS